MFLISAKHRAFLLLAISIFAAAFSLTSCFGRHVLDVDGARFWVSLVFLCSLVSSVLLTMGNRRRAGRLSKERVREIGLDQQTLRSIANLDKFLRWTGKVDNLNQEQRLEQYKSAVMKLDILEMAPDLKAAIFYSYPENVLTLAPPKKQHSIRHEFLHLYQEIAYGIISKERNQRLSLFDIVRAELEVTYFTSTTLFSFWVLLVCLVPVCLWEAANLMVTGLTYINSEIAIYMMKNS